MAKNKTNFTDKSVIDFVNEVEQPQKKADSLRLIDMMRELTGCEPQMYGPTIIGFGAYHYKYESGHEGDAPILAFSPRKAAISLYVYSGLEEHKYLLEGLGKFKMGKACTYINKLSDIDEDVLKKIMRATIVFVKEKYG
jgi:hypothetical protein